MLEFVAGVVVGVIGMGVLDVLNLPHIHCSCARGAEED